MTDKERWQNIQFLILPSTIAVVDKGTSLHCYYVQMCRTREYACDTWSTYFYIIAVKGCSFIYHSNCNLSVMFIVLLCTCMYILMFEAPSNMNAPSYRQPNHINLPFDPLSPKQNKKKYTWWWWWWRTAFVWRHISVSKNIQRRELLQ